MQAKVWVLDLFLRSWNKSDHTRRRRKPEIQLSALDSHPVFIWTSPVFGSNYITPYGQHRLARTTTKRDMRVVITFRDDAANDADGAEHAKDGEVLVLLVGG